MNNNEWFSFIYYKQSINKTKYIYIYIYIIKLYNKIMYNKIIIIVFVIKLGNKGNIFKFKKKKKSNILLCSFFSLLKIYC